MFPFQDAERQLVPETYLCPTKGWGLASPCFSSKFHHVAPFTAGAAGEPALPPAPSRRFPELGAWDRVLVTAVTLAVGAEAGETSNVEKQQLWCWLGFTARDLRESASWKLWQSPLI